MSTGPTKLHSAQANGTVGQNMKSTLSILSACAFLFAAQGCATAPSTSESDDGPAIIAALATKAEAGDAIAQNDLGSRYQSGDGVSKNPKKAFELYQKAAASGLALPESNLGFMYDLGLGTPQNRELANEWYLKSAEQGHAPAMFSLGLNIAEGKGAAPDIVEGMKWIDLARFLTEFDRNIPLKWKIRDVHDKMKEKMSQAEFDEATRRSKAWYEEFQAKQNFQAKQKKG